MGRQMGQVSENLKGLDAMRFFQRADGLSLHTPGESGETFKGAYGV